MATFKKKKIKTGISRRDFLKGSGLVVGGFVNGAAGASFLISEHAVEVSKAKGYIA